MASPSLRSSAFVSILLAGIVVAVAATGCGPYVPPEPVVCAVDRGMVKGMLGALVDAGDPSALGEVTTEASIARGDTFCSTAV